MSHTTHRSAGEEAARAAYQALEEGRLVAKVMAHGRGDAAHGQEGGDVQGSARRQLEATRHLDQAHLRILAN
jgi:hypothetical protein